MVSCPINSEEHHVSEQPSDTPRPPTLKEVCAILKVQLDTAEHELDKIFHDDDHSHHSLSVQMVAAQAANTANCVSFMLGLLEALSDALGNRVDQLRDTVRPLIERSDLDEATRADMLDRIEHLEYATVAEGQVERLMEQLTGDVADRIAGRLKAEDGS